MTISKKEYFVLSLLIISLILFAIIVNWINYLSNNDYVNYIKLVEGFNSSYISDGHVGGSTISKNKSYKKYVPAENDAGKLTFGVTSPYSSLTTDIGTEAKTFSSNKFSITPKLSNGVNTWSSKFNKQKTLYDSKYMSPQLQYMPQYNKRYSISGEFLDIGPLASNAYLK